MHQFNQKPILTRPYQHFYHEANYFEIDVDVHSWLYVARKAFWTLLPRMHEVCMSSLTSWICVYQVITEVALLIQGNRPEDLPEHIVAVARVYRVNLTRFRYLSDFLEQSRQKEDAQDNTSPEYNTPFLQQLKSRVQGTGDEWDHRRTVFTRITVSNVKCRCDACRQLFDVHAQVGLKHKRQSHLKMTPAGSFFSRRALDHRPFDMIAQI